MTLCGCLVQFKLDLDVRRSRGEPFLLFQKQQITCFTYIMKYADKSMSHNLKNKKHCSPWWLMNRDFFFPSWKFQFWNGTNCNNPDLKILQSPLVHPKEFVKRDAFSREKKKLKEGGKANFLPESLGVLFWKCIASLRLDNESLKGARSVAQAVFLRPVNTTFQR